MFKKYNDRGRGNDRGGDRYEKRGGGRSFGGGRSEMFRTTCATCGDACEVPFRPANGKPIYCRSCFQNEMDSQPKFAGKSFSPSSFKKYREEEKRLYDAECSMCGVDCEVPFKPAAGRPVYCNTCMRNEDRMPMTGPKPMNAFSKSAPLASEGASVSKADFDALNAKVDRILNLLEGVMNDASLDEEINEDEMDDMEDDSEWGEDEEFASDLLEEEDVEETVAPKKTKKTAEKKTSKKAPAKKSKK